MFRWDGPDLDAWQPWTPQQAAERLRDCGAHWFVVGGWAIDLFVGRQTRPHADLEIAIPRDEFPLVRRALPGFALHAVGSGEVVRLEDHEATPADKHQNWVLDPTENLWRMDVMLEPGDVDTWRFRRDERVQAPRGAITGERDGVPYLRPEAALLFKAKSARAKDEADLAQALPLMGRDARERLADALRIVHPGHSWIERMA